MIALLVDDDYFVITALQNKIDWSSLQIDQVFVASNIAQAKVYFQTQNIHILICDIEMPQGSGLELLAWIREAQYDVQAIFLTNYADFNYAQKAIELRSFEYFLKPIEFDKLTLIIQKAVRQAIDKQNQEKAVKEGYYWKRNEKKMIEHFWRKLAADKSTLMKAEAITDAIAEQNLSYQLTDLFVPILFNLFPEDRSLGKEHKDLFAFALHNVLQELFQPFLIKIEAMLEYKDFNWIAILRWDHTLECESIKHVCSSFITKANQLLKCDTCCTIANVSSLESIQLLIRQLIHMDEEIVKSRNQIFFLDQYRQQDVAYTPPDLAKLDELLHQVRPFEFLEETTRYLNALVHDEHMNVSVLSLFRLDMVQLVYAFLKGKEIQAHKLYTGRTNDQLFAQSLNSIEDMVCYLEYLLHTAMAYRAFTEQPDSVVDKIMTYVHAHLDGELTRISLAEVVYLNPDYLARIFKKETGISLGTFILQARINRAKQLLMTTNLSINTIARKVGYGNPPHFSKFFKQETGQTPNEYRKTSS